MSVSFEKEFHSIQPEIISPTTNLDMLWHLGYFFQKDNEPRPSWAGFNACVVRDKPVKASVIRMQPIIDLNPTDMSCVYSTLVYIINESKKLNIRTPTVTFDQPLWLKAVKIASACNLNVVCRLGAFHMEMSFLGSLGILMADSGLAEVMQCCYGVNTVKHIFTGKAVSRAIRAHFLVESALTVLLLEEIATSENNKDALNEVLNFYNGVLSDGFDAHSTSFPDGLFSLERALQEVKENLQQRSRTAKLWIQYLEYVSLLKKLLRAERTGDWLLHLGTVRRMINLFAATGHNNYAKCARLYIEMMDKLSTENEDLHQQFVSGRHVAHRSGKRWAGLSTDLTIEQAMMRALKGHGGLTHGRGVSESVRTLWVASVHKTSAVKTALAELTSLEYDHDSVQHPELGKARAKRDNIDLEKMLDFLKSHNPFTTSHPGLHSLTSGVSASADDGVNCDEAERVGALIVGKMNGLQLKDVKLKRSEQIKTLAHVTSVASKTDKKNLGFEPTMLFNRLLVIMQRSPNMKPYFAYELSSLPTSLFKDKLMRKTDKSQLAKELHKNVASANAPQSSLHVIDGGYLLHVVHWDAGTSYAQVAHQYVTYVNKNFSRSSVIVFDGYNNGPSIKDQEHQRRSGNVAPNIVIDEEKICFKDQNAFLANEQNKSAFVSLLVSCLQAAGHTALTASDDADTLVVKQALTFAKNGQVVSVIANDTDILVMLVYHYQPDMADVFMHSHSSQRINSVRAIAVSLGPVIRSRLLVVHAISGCDTTSCLFGHGKASAYRKICNASGIQHLIDVLECSTATHEEVTLAGCSLIALLYGGSVKDRLNNLRYSTYMHVTATTTQLPRPERLPPTENAARYHSYRVHLQTLQWKMLSTTVANPLEWGWKEHDIRFIPVATDIEVAPPDILKVACCKCRSDSKRPCDSQKCMCKFYQLPCTTACKNCTGTACENRMDPSIDFSGDYDNVVDVDFVTELAACDAVDECVLYEEDLDYFMPWQGEEEVATS